MLNKQDVRILRKLAGEVAEIAALPEQEEKRNLWRKLNGLDPARPMVMIDQVCWNEIKSGEEMALQCSERECREYEEQMRKILFQWRHFPVDMVVEPYIKVFKAIRNSGFGIGVQQQVAVGDPANSVTGHKYENQFENEADLEKIREPVVSHDEAETERRMVAAHEIFDGVIEVRAWGADPYLSLWDPLATWMGVENALYTMMDKPELVHAIVKRMADGYLAMLTQMEEQGLLCGPQEIIHCTGAYTYELPAPGYDPQRPRAKDMWMFGLAQMLATVSPPMFKEFEVDYTSEICARFGLVYYGCCDPLDAKMAEVRMLPNVRKISMSPWTDQERGAKEIAGNFVFSRKPNPAFLAPDLFHPDHVRSDLIETRDICEKHGCPLEFILKDISTFHYEPERLFEWARIAMDVAGSPVKN